MQASTTLLDAPQSVDQATPSNGSPLVCHENAIVIPAPVGRTANGILPAAVLDATGGRIAAAECETNDLSSTPFQPSEAQCVPTGHLAGRWLFGGIATKHFGHQITRMLGRLPWLDEAGDLDGIVFPAFRGSSNHRDTRRLRDALLEFFGVDLPVVIPFETIRVDALLVGPDLFGEGRMCMADPRFVEWSRRRLGRDAHEVIPGRKIYVTRTGLPGPVGRFACEEVLEENLAANGYEILRPEDHSLADQFATYASAETIVMADGSPGHVTAFARRPGQTQIVLARRRERPLYMLNHLESFASDGGEFHFVDVLNDQWWPPARASNVSIGSLDFDQLRDALCDKGALPADPVWRSPSAAELETSKRRDLAVGQRLLDDASRKMFLIHLRSRRRNLTMLKDLDRTATDLPAINGLRYLRVLSRMHRILQPDWYLEVGTFTGKSLSHAQGNYIAVDPMFRIEHPIVNSGGRRMYLFQETSDDFFASHFVEKNDIRVNMAFLDGLHHFEVLLRDFIATEKLMAEGGVIAMHDCCPTTHQMTTRAQGDGAWTGDVWKTMLILLRNRPDLTIDCLDARPTGLVTVRGLDPNNRVLEEAYDDLVSEYAAMSLNDLEGGLEGYYREVPLIPALDGLERLKAH